MADDERSSARRCFRDWRRTARPRRVWRVPVVLAGCAVGIASACGGSDCKNGTCTDVSSARLLDRLCTQPLPDGPVCETSGGAMKTTGISADTIGYRLSGSTATLTVHLEGLDTLNTSGTFGIEILAATSDDKSSAQLSANLSWGNCTSCGQPPTPTTVNVGADYRWITVLSNQPMPSGGIPYSAVLTLTGNDVDIADMQTTSVYADTSCSIAGPIGARH